VHELEPLSNRCAPSSVTPDYTNIGLMLAFRLRNGNHFFDRDKYGARAAVHAPLGVSGAQFTAGPNGARSMSSMRVPQGSVM